MRLLVVRCLAFVVVQALMRPRVNAGVNAGTLASLCSACRAESILKATAGLSVCVSTVSFGLHRRGFVYSGNWEGRMSAVCLGAICSTVAESSALTGEKDYASSASVRAFDGARYVSPALGRAVLD